MPYSPQRQGEREAHRSRSPWGSCGNKGLRPLLHTSWLWHGGCLGLTSCHGAATISGPPWGARPFPSDIPNERPGPGPGGRGRVQEGVRGWQFPAHPASAACPLLISRQSCPLGGRAQALDLVNLLVQMKAEPEHSHAAPAPGEGPQAAGSPPGLGLSGGTPHSCTQRLHASPLHHSVDQAHPRPSRSPSHRAHRSVSWAPHRCSLALTVSAGRGGQPTKAGRARPLWEALLGDPGATGRPRQCS